MILNLTPIRIVVFFKERLEKVDLLAWQRSSTKLSWNTKGGHAFWISPSKKSRSSCHLTPTSWLFMGIFDLRWLWINWRWKETCSRTITIVASTDLFLQSWIKRCFLCLQLLRISAMHCFTIYIKIRDQRIYW